MEQLWQRIQENTKYYSRSLRLLKLQDTTKDRTNIVLQWWLWIIKTLSEWNIDWKNIDCRIHSSLSKSYPYEYAYALMKSNMTQIEWLATFWTVLRNIMNLASIQVIQQLFETINKKNPSARIPKFDIDLYERLIRNKNRLETWWISREELLSDKF